MNATTATNGTVKSTEQPKQEVLTTAKKNQQTKETELIADSDFLPNSKPLTFDERMQAISKANVLSQNFSKLVGKSKELEELLLPIDDGNVSVTFNDHNGEEWETKNPKIIAIVRDELNKAFKARIAECQKEIEAIKFN